MAFGLTVFLISPRKKLKYLKYLILATFFFILTACSGEDDAATGFQLDGAAVSGAFDPTSEEFPTVYGFDVQAELPYSVSLVDLEGYSELYIYDANPFESSSANYIASAYGGGESKIASFIAASNGTVYAVPISLDAVNSTRYSISASTNHINEDEVKSAANFNSFIYYSFNAQADTTYEVRVTPLLGDVNITVVTLRSDMSGSVGSSYNTGSLVDSVFFNAAGSGRYYVRVDGTYTDSNYDIEIIEVPPGPDFKIDVLSASSDASNLTISYRINNNGADAYTGDLQVDFWTDSVPVRSLGVPGDHTITLTNTYVAGLGGYVTGTVTIPTTADNGVAYAVVDTLNLVAEADEFNNNSTVIGWTKPLLAPLSYDFEDSLVPAGMDMSGDADWVVDTTTGANGSINSFKSGNVTHDQQSCFSVSVYNSANTYISFDRKVSSESTYDNLIFYIDGFWSAQWSGEEDWARVGFNSSAGSHTYKWCYVKDGLASAGADGAWVDNISFTPVPTDLSVNINSAVSDGANVTINYTVFNSSTIATGEFNVDFWSDAVSSPIVGDTGESSVTHSSLTAYGSVSGTVVIANAADSGSAYAIVDTQNLVHETSETNNSAVTVAWIQPIQGPLSLDFEDALMPAELISSGDAIWSIDTTTGGSGTVKSIRAGLISHNQMSCVQTTVITTSRIRFDYSVSSEANWDYFRFYIDGVQQFARAGTLSWGTAIYDVTAGPHEYKWCYTKDGSVNIGSDTAWIDSITID